MRTSEADILMVPGWMGSDPEHWQSRWERSLKTARRVEPGDLAAADKDQWVRSIIDAVASTSRPVVLVGHSLGVMAIAQTAAKLPEGSVSGAFLVAPADLDNADLWPPMDANRWPELNLGFAPVPLRSLPFRSALLASSTDPYCALERARHIAAAWGSELVEVGDAGHVNSASGHGPWPDGVLRFGKFLAGLDP